MRLVAHPIVLALLVFIPIPGANADPLPSNFTLGRFVPGDVWMFINKTPNSEREWLQTQWEEVFSAIGETKIDRELLTLVLSAMPEAQRPELASKLEGILTSVRAVQWRDLLQGEVAFAERISPKLPGYDYYFLSRTSPESAKTNIAALVDVLEQYIALTNNAKLVHDRRHKVDMWTVKKHAAYGGAPEGSLTLFRKADLIGIVFGQNPMADVLALINGKNNVSAINTSPRLRQALKLVEAPRDAVLFFDIKLLLGNLSQLTKQMNKPAGKPSGEITLAKIVGKLMQLGDVLDFAVTSIETRGRREFSHTVTRLQPNKSGCSIACACLKRKPFDKFDKYIPQDASAFSLNSTFDLEATYDLIVEFIQKNITNGPQIVEQLQSKLAAVGFDMKRDFFSWWSGEMISVTLPASVVTPMGSTDSVVMFRVKDTELASRKVASLLDQALNVLQSRGQFLTMRQIDLGSGEFRQITHPLLAMFARPVVGVTDGWLMVATSSSSIKQCLAVARGEAPSIRTNQRFIEEGIAPTGPVRSASYKDTSLFGAELAAVASMVSVFGSMALTGIPGDTPEAVAAKNKVKQVLTLVQTIAPVLQKLDFYSSESVVTTYDGSSTIRSQKVVTYKKPAVESKTVKAQPPPR